MRDDSCPWRHVCLFVGVVCCCAVWGGCPPMDNITSKGQLALRLKPWPMASKVGCCRGVPCGSSGGTMQTAAVANNDSEIASAIELAIRKRTWDRVRHLRVEWIGGSVVV